MQQPLNYHIKNSSKNNGETTCRVCDNKEGLRRLMMNDDEEQKRRGKISFETKKWKNRNLRERKRSKWVPFKRDL